MLIRYHTGVPCHVLGSARAAVLLWRPVRPTQRPVSPYSLYTPPPILLIVNGLYRIEKNPPAVNNRGRCAP